MLDFTCFYAFFSVTTHFSDGRKRRLAFAKRVEDFLSQPTSSIYDGCHCVSARSLQGCIDDAVFRYDTRKQGGGELQDSILNSAGVIDRQSVEMAKIRVVNDNKCFGTVELI